MAKAISPEEQEERQKKVLATETNIYEGVEHREKPEGEDDWEVEAETQAASMTARYKINPRLLRPEYHVHATLTKIQGYGKSEDVVLRAKIGRWVKDIVLNPRDKEYLLLEGVGKEYIGIIGTYEGRHSGKKYYGIRFDLGNNEQLNYAFTVNKKVDDFRILVKMDYVREVKL